MPNCASPVSRAQYPDDSCVKRYSPLDAPQRIEEDLDMTDIVGLRPFEIGSG